MNGRMDGWVGGWKRGWVGEGGVVGGRVDAPPFPPKVPRKSWILNILQQSRILDLDPGFTYVAPWG